jgi:hypothetical protein
MGRRSHSGKPRDPIFFLDVQRSIKAAGNVR